MRVAVALILLIAPTAASAQDAAKRGPILFLQCRACHNLKAGEPHKVGPNLNGFLARAGASAPDFKYSAAFSAAKPRWTDATLDAWLARPGQLVKGTNMAFAGMAKPADRAALISYLKTATK
jgi:cytochrome c